MFNVIETPWLLLSAAFVLLVVITVVRRSRPEKRRWWQLFLPAVLLGSAFALDFFVKTDYEKIQTLMSLGKKSVIDRNINQIDTIISPHYYDAGHNSKENFMAFCRFILSKPLLKKVKTRYNKLTISAPEAISEMEIVAHLLPESVYASAGRIVFVKAKLYFTKTYDKNWLISSFEILEINKQPFNWKYFR